MKCAIVPNLAMRTSGQQSFTRKGASALALW
jgi:hypothetical protein